MSQFDFPRIVFYGETIVNPPTANNNSFMPLCIYDPINVKVLIPPRIYLSQKLIRMNELGALPVPHECEIKIDIENGPYVEISSIRSAEIFKQWVTTPLGQFPLDYEFHNLYDVVTTAKEHTPLRGLIPASWNYYGGMDFAFKNVEVTSVEMPDFNYKTTKADESDELAIPAIIDTLSNATIDLNNINGRNSAVMVDVIPSLSFIHKSFAILLCLEKMEKCYLKVSH